ncbi:TetR/AcrR family transcriptional regulator [Rhizorhabdus dicambivorans]|uniref:TetR/AcrR family transcriptional regulator n=2 Tax=Rhizorhabdus dicambivorans TaxID=1850238 RepID=A0A2A4FM87_9SPHN|nr:TetR/AcrR family transcriptional regulator [Rhizorhabdus dicambivorans]PCE39865.1 TetR/AcrR family transcriptional regulator [Rhizorhabdus dicambivorans]
MRAHLMQSILSVCSGRKLTGSTVIEEVVRHAGVSRGTFYTYFDSLDEAVIQLAFELAEEMTAGIGALDDVINDPVLRTAVGFQTFLMRALMDANWGAFIIHLDLLDENALVATGVRGNIRRGIEAGEFNVESVDTAADLLMGAKHEAIRRIIAGQHDPAFIHSMTSMVLRAFGLSSWKADKIVAEAYALLCREAPAKLGWWQPIDGPGGDAPAKG